MRSKLRKTPRLNGDKNNGEYDPNYCGDQSNSVMKQIAERKREDESHRALHRVRILEDRRNGMALTNPQFRCHDGLPPMTASIQLWRDERV